MISAVVYSQPNCGPCVVMKKMLTKYLIPFEVRDVQQDEQALAEVREFHEMCAPGRPVATPVVVIDDADGAGSREVLFGAAIDELKALIRDRRVVA